MSAMIRSEWLTGPMCPTPSISAVVPRGKVFVSSQATGVLHVHGGMLSRAAGDEGSPNTQGAGVPKAFATPTTRRWCSLLRAVEARGQALEVKVQPINVRLLNVLQFSVRWAIG